MKKNTKREINDTTIGYALFLFAIVLLFLLLRGRIGRNILSGRNTDPGWRDLAIDVTDPSLEVNFYEWADEGAVISASFTVHNLSDSVAICKVDPYKNYYMKNRQSYLIPHDCFIPPRDSCRLSFTMEHIPEAIPQEGLVLKNSEYVVMFVNGQKKSFSFKDKSKHRFTLKDKELLGRLRRRRELETQDSFMFLGEADGRKENFDECPYPVTTENFRHLYRAYQVEKLEEADLYKVTPEKIYLNSRYFTRLLRFKGNQQVASATFYDWNIRYIFKQDDHYLAAFNSLATTAGGARSSFTCKTVLLDSLLNKVSEREFRYKEQQEQYEYSYIDTLYQSKGEGYEFVVINTGFDVDDYYRYVGHLSFDNVVTSSSRQKIKIR